MSNRNIAAEHAEQMESGHPSDPVLQRRGPKLNSQGLVLTPQPSNDPNDPLNWAAWEKYLTYLPVCFFTFLATMNASNLTVAVRPLAAEFNKSPTVAGYLVCFNVLFLGVGNIFWVPLSRVIGKRPVYLAAMLVVMGANIWSFFSHSYGSLLASRIISGFGAAAGDATVPSLVADLFFVHERGHCMMIFHLALSSGFFLGPMICAWVMQGAGWRWTCCLLAVAAGSVFLFGLFAIRETNYCRRSRDEEVLPDSAYPPKRRFVDNLSISRGYNKSESFIKTVLRIFTMVAYPPVLWTGLTAGVFVGWNIVVQLTISQTFTRPPYGWQIGKTGCLGIAGFIGALLAFFVGGKFIDMIATRMTKSNGGVRQPEFRLPAILIPGIIGPMGILTFGLCVSHHTSWVGAAFGYGMEGFGLTAVSNVVVTYAVDGYPELAGEALVVVFVIRNALGTILALYTTDWQEKAGISHAFEQMVGIQYFLILLVIPIYVFGKGIRAWTKKFGPAKELATPRTNENPRDIENVDSSKVGAEDQ